MKKLDKRIVSLLAVVTVMASASGVVKAANEVNTEPVYAEYNYEGITVYTIQKGDTLGQIALKFYGSSALYKELALYNGLEDPNRIYNGQVILIPKDLSVVYDSNGNQIIPEVELVEYPEDSYYTVRCGDRMEIIAESFFGVKDRCLVDRIATYNGLSDPNKIVVGQVLRIPVYEKLMNVVPNDYTAQYNEMAKKLSELKKCRAWWHKHHQCNQPYYMPETCIPVYPPMEQCPILVLTPGCNN